MAQSKQSTAEPLCFTNINSFPSVLANRCEIALTFKCLAVIVRFPDILFCLSPHYHHYHFHPHVHSIINMSLVVPRISKGVILCIVLKASMPHRVIQQEELLSLLNSSYFCSACIFPLIFSPITQLFSSSHQSCCKT